MAERGYKIVLHR